MIPTSNCQREKQGDGTGCRAVRSREIELCLSWVRIAGEIIQVDNIIRRESRQSFKMVNKSELSGASNMGKEHWGLGHVSVHLLELPM